MSAHLKEELRKIVCDVAEIDECPDHTPFQELGIDSMMAIEIVADVERQYKLSIPENELSDLRDLNAVYLKVTQKLADKAA
jgi:acyl carrier protein